MKIIDSTGVNLYDSQHLIAEPTGRYFRSRLPNAATEIQLAADKAYFVYVGRIAHSVPLQYVELYVSTAGAGSNGVELGLFSTPAAPNQAGQNLTKLAAAATGDIDSLLTTGVKFNSNASFGYTAPAGTYLWAGIRTTTAYSTQPKLSALCLDFGEGLVLSTASAGAFSGAGPWTGSLITPSPYWNSVIAPDLRVRWSPAG